MSVRCPRARLSRTATLALTSGVLTAGAILVASGCTGDGVGDTEGQPAGPIVDPLPASGPIPEGSADSDRPQIESLDGPAEARPGQTITFVVTSDHDPASEVEDAVVVLRESPDGETRWFSIPVTPSASGPSLPGAWQAAVSLTLSDALSPGDGLGFDIALRDAGGAGAYVSHAVDVLGDVVECPTESACGTRVCGIDPVCGLACGTCADGEGCTLEGTCEVVAAGDGDGDGDGDGATCSEWSRQFGTNAHDRAEAVTTDDEDHVVVAGATEGELEGQVAAGSDDVFAIEFDANGAAQWRTQLGSDEIEYVRGVAVDATGAVWVVGGTGGVMAGAASAGFEDVFVVQLAPDGSTRWIDQVGSAASDRANGIAADGQEAVVVGYAYAALPGQSSSGAADVFVTRYGSDGSRVWTRQRGGPASDFATGVALDPAGQIYVCGYTISALDGEAALGGRDAFVMKFDAAGTWQWTRQLGTPAFDQAEAITFESGTVFVAGSTRGALDGPSSGSDDAFVVAMDPDGTTLWSRQLGSDESDVARGIAGDGSGAAFLVGHTRGALPGQSSAGSYDVFLAGWDALGAPLEIRTFGSTSIEYSAAVSFDATGGATVVGVTNGELAGSALGGEDAYALHRCGVGSP